MQVKVLQHHIDEGLRGASSKCAIALALAEAGVEEPMVFGDGSLSGFADGHFVRSPEDPVLEKFIGAFDCGCGVEPFTTEVDWMHPFLTEVD
jgi:hypothetical protein